MTTTEADFVNKELNTRDGTVSIKKIAMQNKSDDTELDKSYQKAIIAENDKKKNPTQMKEWSILSDHVKYVKSDGSETFHKLNIGQMNYRHERGNKGERIVKCRCKFWQIPRKIKKQNT